MESIVRTVSHKDGGEVTDAEENTTTRTGVAHSTRARTPQRSSLEQQQEQQPGQPQMVVATSTQDEAELSNGRSNLVVADNIPEGIVEDDEDEDEDEEDDYEYEDDDDAAFSGFLADSNAAVGVATVVDNEPATIEEEDQQPAKQKWREPSKAAVNMSLRAEKETSGGKRRLAQDLYRIMNQDTEEAGFSLQPSQEDSMDKWTIQLFQFDEDSKLAKDMKVLGVQNIELEMTFPDHYPFEPPFVRVARPRFRRQTGFVMNGALCMELLTKDGWNPINDIESVIVSIRSLLVVGDGRLEAACNLSEAKYNALLEAAKKSGSDEQSPHKKQKAEERDSPVAAGGAEVAAAAAADGSVAVSSVVTAAAQGGSYSVSEAQAAYSHLSDYHKKKGWDTSGWWARKG